MHQFRSRYNWHLGTNRQLASITFFFHQQAIIGRRLSGHFMFQLFFKQFCVYERRIGGVIQGRHAEFSGACWLCVSSADGVERLCIFSLLSCFFFL